jgi:hypothetical protein|tara:strand:- start:61 stop:246 length:186 start_codon:yes stop_codon:yes gene_type:complete
MNTTTTPDAKETINITPSWEYAVSIYLLVLDNPDASASGRLTAKEEIMRLARMVDKITEVD